MFAANTILDCINQAVIATDIGGVVRFWNRAAEELYGESAKMVIGRPLREVLPDDDPSPIFDAIRAGRTWSGTRRSPRNSGLLLVRGCALRDKKSGELTGFIIVSTLLDNFDLQRVITESERRLESRLLQAERVSSLGRLAASVAHEFNNVLMGIQPFIDVLTRRAGSDPAVKLAAPRIADAVARGKRITQEILRFTRIAEPSRVALNVAEWLQAFEPEITQLAGAAVAVTIDADSSLTMLADPHQLRQVFANLVVNAHDAMPSGGRLEIRAVADTINGGSDGRTNVVHFTIRDTGVGMPEETLLYIFEPLFTTKRFGGTGLGLAVASQILQQHQGHIYAESVPDQGTTFHVILPAAGPLEVAPARVLPRPPRERVVRPGMRVTLIEDEESVGAGLVAILDYEGISVDWVRLGADALIRIAAQFPDAVILDLGLPDVDGIKVYQQIAARWPDLPVLFSTGHGDEKLLTAAHEGKRVGYLQKPYESDALLAALDELLRQ
jgi:signal transduction histidine kinase